jgi:hypothetical protein
MQKTRRKRAHFDTLSYSDRANDIKEARKDFDKDLKRMNMPLRKKTDKRILRSSWSKFFGMTFKHNEVSTVAHKELWDKKSGLPKDKDAYSRKTLDKLPIIVTGKRSHFLGMSWKRIGSRPQRISRSNPSNRNFLVNNMKSTYPLNVISDAVNEWHIIDGSWDTSIAQLQRFANAKVHTLNVNMIFVALNCFAHELVLPALDSPCFESIFNLKIKWRAQPGYDQNPECATKGKAWVRACSDARILWEYFGLDYRPAVFEWLVGGRWRRNKKLNDDALESRAVLFNVFSMDLINMLYAQPLTMAIKKLDAGSNYLGHAMQKLGYERYIAWKRADVYNVDTDTSHAPNVFIAIDAKSHDSSRTYKHKSIVMSLIRGCFPESSFVDRHFYAITHNLCNLKVVTPGGFTYLFEDGNPSGTPFTSWISTLSNWIDWCCIRYFCPHLRDNDGLRIALEVIVAGDDTEVKAFVPDDVEIDWEAVAIWAKTNCSLDIPFEEWSFKEVEDCEGELVDHLKTEAVSFLKVSIFNECEGTHQIKHFANKDLCPKTVLKKRFQPVDHFLSLISVHSEDPRMRQFIAKRYFQNVYYRDPIIGQDDEILLDYENHIRQEANQSNRSFDLKKFFSFYQRGKHPGKPDLFMEKNGESTKSQMNRLQRNHGFTMYDLLMISKRKLSYEFYGLDSRDGSDIDIVENSKRYYKGFDARRYPFKGFT